MKSYPLGLYLSWALSHQAEVKTIIAASQLMIADFPGFADNGTPLARLAPPSQTSISPVIKSDEDQQLEAAIAALDDGELDDDHVVYGRIFGGRPPAVPQTDPVTGQPVPQQPRFTGALLKQLLENLPAIIQAVQLFTTLIPK